MVCSAFSLVFGYVVAQDPDIYDKLPRTRLGCQCKTPCTTSVKFECNVAEFCTVEDKDCSGGVAPWSLSHGHYDWCVYTPYQLYESQSALEKQQILLNKIAGDQGSGEFPGALNVLTGLIGESVMLTFDADADVFPHLNRKKYIHSVGVAGGIKFESNGQHPFTGLFQGAEAGIVRLSSAKQPGKGGMTPGMGIKFLRDGRESANLVAMYSLGGQPCEETNFFEHVWSNHIPATNDFGLKLVVDKFWQGSSCPQMVGLSDFATIDTDTPAAPGSFPFELHFAPRSGTWGEPDFVHVDCDCMDYDECIHNLEAIPNGTPLFGVWARASPGALLMPIGNITLTSKLVASAFGDEQLFFQHQRMENDFAIHPEWLDALDLKTDCGMTGASGSKPTIEQGCNSPFNSTMLTSDLSV